MVPKQCVANLPLGKGDFMRTYILAAGLLAGLATSAWAADLETRSGNGLYISAGFGLSHEFDPEFNADGASGKLDFDNGWVGSIALGIAGQSLRAELEVARRENDLQRIEIDGLGTIDTNGQSRLVTALAKVDYEITLGGVRPFIGLGAGMARYTIELDAPENGSDSEMVLAGEAEAGLTVPLSSHLEAFGVGQILILRDPHLDPTSTGGAELDDPTFLSAEAGLRLHF
jgi:opacity protein-like surface antigen